MTTPDLDPRTLSRLAAGHPAFWALLASRGKWEVSPHLQLLAEKLLDLAAGRIRRLAVSMPPRHGKTTFVSQHFPAWWLGVHPEHRVMLVAHQHEFAASWAGRVRDSLAEWGPDVFGVTASPKAAAAAWDLLDAESGRRTGGGCNAYGTGAGIAGRGGDLIVVDDPLPGQEAANSPTQRAKAWAWFQADLLTRAEPGARVLCVATRWHEDDVIGRIEAQQDAGEGGEPWTIINLPAIAEDDDDPLGRAPGEALWPARFPVEALDVKRREVGPWTWSALYQGRPAPAEGGLFKRDWLRYYQRPDERHVLFESGGVHRRLPVDALRRWVVADLAVSTKSSADYTVAQCWGMVPGSGELLLLDQLRARLEGPDLVPALARMVDRWGAGTLWIESVAFQLSIVQHARRAGLPVRELTADRDKVSRALPATAAMEGGRVYFPAGVPWVEDLEAELLTFPAARHDDQVDALAYAVHVAGEGRMSPPIPPDFLEMVTVDGEEVELTGHPDWRDKMRRDAAEESDDAFAPNMPDSLW